MPAIKLHNVPYQATPKPQRLYEYSIAYIKSARALCVEMIDDESASWPRAAVVLMLAAHATEVYLKALIAHRTGAFDNGHDIEILRNAYRAAYGNDLEFFLPMTEVGWRMTEEERAFFRKKKVLEDPSIVNRYPFLDMDNEWRGLHVVEPVGLVGILDDAAANMIEKWESLNQ